MYYGMYVYKTTAISLKSTVIVHNKSDVVTAAERTIHNSFMQTCVEWPHMVPHWMYTMQTRNNNI